MLHPLQEKGYHYLDEKEVNNQLHHILSSHLFSGSAVLSTFLKFIVEQTLDGHADGLKEYTIAVDALGKPADFNPQIDAIVRIHAGRLRRLLNEYYTGPGRTDPIRIEVVKGTYVPVFRAQLSNKLKIEESGSMPAVEDNNSKSTDEVNVRENALQYFRSKLTLAVLPIRNLCPDNTHQFFADGLGEELTRIFSTSSDIDVISHHSTRKYATEQTDMRIIGQDLGVHYLITGSVMRTNKEIRINIGLAETFKSTQIWSKSYKHTLDIDNLLDIQDQIMEDVFSVLGGYYGFIVRNRVHSVQRKNFSDLQSFDAVLWNYYFHMNFSREAYLKTREALEQALERDPDFATGAALLGELYLDAYTLGYPTVEDPVSKSYQLSKKAIEIDPQCQHGYQEYAWANIYLKRKEEAIVAMEHCLKINPSSVAFTGAIGFGMACAGEYQRAHALLTRSLDLNPHCPWWFHLGFFLVYYQDRQYQKALEHADKIVTTDVFLDPLLKLAARGELGLHSEAQEDIEVLTNKFPQIVADLKMHLSTFLLDDTLVDSILEGAKKAGLPPS